MSLDPDFTFSANSLQDYKDCHRRFELKYLLKQSWPAEETEPVLDWERELQLGSQFHQMVFQYLNGLPQEALLAGAQDPDLVDWFGNFLAFYTALDLKQIYPEFRVRIPLGSYQAVAVFDLLALTADGRLLILDWKTAKKVSRRSFMAERMQTLLYPLAALESAANFLPGVPLAAESLQMTYVFVRQSAENTLSFNYDAHQHTANRKRLEGLVNEIVSLELRPFPKTDDERRCKFCAYRSLCERGESAGALSDLEERPDLDLDALLSNLDFEAGDEIAF